MATRKTGHRINLRLGQPRGKGLRIKIASHILNKWAGVKIQMNLTKAQLIIHGVILVEKY